jgi:GNAT superfamily N-acetyltransferase
LQTSLLRRNEEDHSGIEFGEAAQAVSFHQHWVLSQVPIITLDDSDIGWLQSTTRDDGFFVAQLFVDTSFQRRGSGSEVMHRLIGEAAQVISRCCLSVVKINPALRLYERLGFRITHEDDRKFYMKRDPDMAAPISN